MRALASQEGIDPEALAQNMLNDWLSALYALEEQGGGEEKDEEVKAAAVKRDPASGLAEDASTRRDTLKHLLTLAEQAISAHPAMALGLGQALDGFFWWGGEHYLGPDKAKPRGVSVPIGLTSMRLHEVAVRQAGCSDPHLTDRLAFLRPQCPCRWRSLVMLGTEVARALAQKRDLRSALEQFKETETHMQRLRTLPFFQNGAHDVSAPLRLNANADLLPASAKHWPVWPRYAWPALGEFLEAHYATFRRDLERILAVDPQGTLFQMASRLGQEENAPKYEDWVRLYLVEGGHKTGFCSLGVSPESPSGLLMESCDLLASRPELDTRCKAPIQGAAFTRLKPGTELKPHFGGSPRLTAHLALRISFGSGMDVGGEQVTWEEGNALIFDDTYPHAAWHRGEGEESRDRYVLVCWFCHPCDRGWRLGRGEEWRRENPLPPWCGEGDDEAGD